MTDPTDLVLLVDDSPLTLAMLSDLVREAGCEPLTARTTAEALVALERGPMMAFVDVHLSGEDGDALCERIRLDDRRWDLPVVMMTGTESREVLRRCFVAGADDFAPKSLEKTMVLSKIDAVRFRRELVTAPRASLGTVHLATRRASFGTVIGRLLHASGYEVLRLDEVDLVLAEEGQKVHCAIVDLDLLDGPASPKLKALLERAAVGGTPVIAVAGKARQLSFEAEPRPMALFDVDDERERLIKYVNLVLIGARLRAEGRGTPRVPFYGVVRYREPGAPEWLAGYGYDLSETGLYVRTLTPLTARKPSEVSFRLTDDQEPILVKANCIWCNAYGTRTVFSYPFGMGLQFTDFPAERWALVREHVHKELAADRRTNPPA